MQHWLFLLYKKSIKASNEYDYKTDLLNEMTIEYSKLYDKTKEHFSDKVEMRLFHIQGVSIMKYVISHRKQYFDVKNSELIGIEMPIYLPMIDGDVNAVMLLSYLDVVIYDLQLKKLKIIDIKTSTMGWNRWHLADKGKADQLVMYKKYFAKQYGFDIRDIEIEFFIVKRTLNPNSEWPQKRIQLFAPPSGKITVNKLEKKFNHFIDGAFNSDGSYRIDKEYDPIAGIECKNCMFCPYRDKHDLCPPSKRLLAPGFKLQN